MVGAKVHGDKRQVEALASNAEVVPADPDYVRLRAFIAIEHMLGQLSDGYVRAYGVPSVPLVLSERSWGGLTRAKRAVLTARDRAQLDITELKLGGTKMDGHVVVPSSDMMSVSVAEQIAASALAINAIRVKNMTAAVDHSIKLLRPYLRNPDVYVGPVGDELVLVYQEMHSGTALERLMEVAAKMVDVRL